MVTFRETTGRRRARLFYCSRPSRPILTRTIPFGAAIGRDRSMTRLSAALFAAVLLTGALAGPAQAQKDQPGDQADVPNGLKSLKDPDPEVRLRSAALLAGLGKTARFAI